MKGKFVVYRISAMSCSAVVCSKKTQMLLIHFFGHKSVYDTMSNATTGTTSTLKYIFNHNHCNNIFSRYFIYLLFINTTADFHCSVKFCVFSIFFLREKESSWLHVCAFSFLNSEAPRRDTHRIH